ncbi:uncharacterized protein RJT20DRAFT_15667 [Scheffersomyces xylosifermentans]|uniref:uncharacterized protein n=1 Tax=Scheffersomyces xylosifermentans TaxID=1304137 RepID=UPI00315D184F
MILIRRNCLQQGCLLSNKRSLAGISLSHKRHFSYSSSSFSLFSFANDKVQPPRKSYNPNSNVLQYIWNQRVSANVKYFGALAFSAYTLTHVHHDTLITVGPPLLLGGYYLYRTYRKRLYAKETSKILDTSLDNDNGKVRFKVYDETELSNVVKGIENQVDHFKRQVVDVVERRIIDYIIRNRDDSTLTAEFSPLFMDENDQFSVNINENEIETWITASVNLGSKLGKQQVNDKSSYQEPEMVDFVKLTLPLYSSKDLSNRIRTGTIQVYLLEVPRSDESGHRTNHEEEENSQEDIMPEHIDYNIGIEVSRFGFLPSKSLFIRDISGEGITKSSLLQEDEETKEDEITI